MSLPHVRGRWSLVVGLVVILLAAASPANKPVSLQSEHWSISIEVQPCPGAGFIGAAALDGLGRQLLLWGGLTPDGDYSYEVLRFPLTSRKLTPLAVAGAEPKAIVAPSLASGLDGRAAFLFGGWAERADSPSDKFFKLALEPGKAKWEPIERAGDWPRGRNGACLVADPKGNSLVLFSGDGGPGKNGFTPLGDLWRYDLSHGRWELVQATGDIPSSRWHAMAVADRTARKMYMLGGAGLGKLDRRLYELDLKTWRWQAMKGKGTVPPSVQGGTLTLDAKEGALLLVGGLRHEGPGPATSADLWVYDLKAESWERLSVGKAVQRRDHVAAYDPVTGLHYVIGGQVSDVVGDFYAEGKPVESAVALRLKRRGE